MKVTIHLRIYKISGGSLKRKIKEANILIKKAKINYKRKRAKTK